MGIVDSLKREFDLEEEWLGFEIHPEIPSSGVPLVTFFPKLDPVDMTRRLNAMGAAYSISFGMIVRISNSRLSLEASEFAKDHGRFEAFHRKVFDAYFTKGKDIGDLDVLVQAAEDVGLKGMSLRKALNDGAYRSKLEQVKEEIGRLCISAAPTFLFNDSDRIVGAQPISVFRDLLGRMGA